MLYLSPHIAIPENEIELSAIRAQGAGGQNVNKVSSAVHLRFDVRSSSLPEFYKERLLAISDSRMTGDGIIVLKAQRHRTQEKNRSDALQRLCELIQSAVQVRKSRVATRPTLSSKRRRVDSKTRKGDIKRTRGRVDDF